MITAYSNNINFTTFRPVTYFYYYYFPFAIDSTIYWYNAFNVSLNFAIINIIDNFSF